MKLHYLQFWIQGNIHFCPPIGHFQERGDYQTVGNLQNVNKKLLIK